MNILDDVLYKEIMEKEVALSQHIEQLRNLPKGSIFISKTSSGNYVYRKWRQEGKVLSEYLGSLESSETLSRIDKVNEYRVVKEQIKQEKKQLAELKKAYRLILLKTKLN